MIERADFGIMRGTKNTPREAGNLQGLYDLQRRSQRMSNGSTCRRGPRQPRPVDVFMDAAEASGVTAGYIGKDGPGFIYILQAGRWFKIGRTTDLGRRLKELRIQLPFKASLVYAAEVPQVKGCEQILHELFAKRRLNGEWFALTDADWRILEAWTSASIEHNRESAE